MHKIWLVLRHEYLHNFRRPAFLFTAFGVPLLSVVAMFFTINLTINQESNLDDFQRVRYIDRALVIEPEAPNEQDFLPVIDPDAMPAETAENLPDYFSELELYAQEQIETGELDAYFVIAENYVLSGLVDVYAQDNIPEALRENIETFMAAQIAFNAPETLPVPPERLGETDLTLRDIDSGEELSGAAIMGRFMMPLLFAILYFMATNTTAQFLMSGVVEEKENRLMEILATSLRPIELLWGKLLGLGALALTQVLVWIVGGLLIAVLNENGQDFLQGMTLSAGDILLIIGLFVVNFVLFSALMLGIGAAVTAEAESRQFAGIFSFITVLPLMLMTMFFMDPNGPVPVLLTFVPFTAAVSLMLRMSLATLPLWQIVVSIVIQIVSVVVVMWLSAKVFRLGMLMYGKRLSPRDLIQALREGRQTLTTASTEHVAPVAQKRKGLWGR